MRYWFKSIFYVCLTLLLSLIACAAYLVFFVDPNAYKSDIIHKIEQSTGRPMAITGKIQWTFFPLLGINVSGLTLGNPPNFPENDFLFVKNAEISVAFKPLLKGNIEVEKIILDQLNVHLIKNASGQVNWQGAVPVPPPATSAEVSSSRTHSTGRLIKLTPRKIAEIKLKNSVIIYDDQQRHKKIALQNLQLTSRDIALDQLFPVQTSFIFKTQQISMPVTVMLDTQALCNSHMLRLQDLNAQTNQYHWQGWLAFNLQSKDLSALNGRLGFSAKSIAFHGIDLYYYSDVAEAVINQTQPTRQDTHQTPIDSIQGSLDIQQGIVNNQDLLIQAKKINASGQGKIDLIHQQLNYQLSLQRLTSEIPAKPRGPAIPIVITGDLGHPKIRSDWTNLAVTEVKAHIKEVMPIIQKGLQSLLGDA